MRKDRATLKKNETNLTVGEKGTKTHSHVFHSCGILVFKCPMHALNGKNPKSLAQGSMVRERKQKHNAAVAVSGPITYTKLCH